MNETKRFIRYLTPGLLFIVELLLFFFILNPQSFYNIVKDLSNIGFAITILIGSGGLGFLFSIFHHSFYWHFYIYMGKRAALFCDHREMLINAEEQGYLSLHLQNGKEIKAKKLSATGAWRVNMAFWHERIKVSKKIEGAIQSTTNLSDLMHGTGAALVACLAAIGVSLFIIFFTTYISSEQSYYWIAYLISMPILFIIHFLNYRMVAKHTQSVINSSSLNDFRSNYDKEGKPIIASATENDLDRENQKKSLIAVGIDKLNFIKKINNHFSKSINKPKK